jgi:hypothetical protein
VMMFWGAISGSSVYFQIWKVRLCQIENRHKIEKKKEGDGGHCW